MAGLVSRVDEAVARWVHPTVEADDERASHVLVFRLIVLTVAGSLCFLPPVLLLGSAMPLAIAVVVGAAAMPLIVAAVLSASGSLGRTGAAALVLSASALAALSAAGGGLASPFAGLLAFLPLAGALAGRTWRWFAAGLAAAVAASGVAIAAGSAVPLGATLALAAVLPVAGLLAFALAHLSVSLERKLATRQAEMASAQANLAATLDGLPGMITIHDLRGDVIAVHGADAGTFRGWLDPMGQGFFQRIHVADRLAFMQALDAVRRGEPRAAVTLRMHAPSAGRPGDRLSIIDASLAPKHDGDGNLEGIVLQSRDVTDLQIAEKEAQARVAAADSANAAKSRHLAAVSHELRTPLNAIIGFSQTLTGEYFGGFESDRQRDYVKLIRQSGDHMLSVVDSLLDLSRIEVGRYDLRYETFEVGAAVRRCEAMLAGQAEAKGVHLTSRVARNCGTATADMRAFDQILINLVANAVKFTEKGGIVTIDAERSGDRLRVSVSDTGIGISTEHLELIGEPFTQVGCTAGRQREGVGLGLSLVKALVALHGGGFSIRSAVGEGTVVTIELHNEGQPAGTQPAEAAIVFPPHLPAGDERKAKKEMDGYDDAEAQTA